MLHRNSMSQKVPKVQFNQGAMRLQGGQIGILADMHARVASRWLHAGGEIFEFHQCVLRSKHFLDQGSRVKSFPWRPFHGAVVKIEAIHIDNGAVRGCWHNFRSRKKQGPPEEAPHPSARSHRGSSLGIIARTGVRFIHPVQESKAQSDPPSRLPAPNRAVPAARTNVHGALPSAEGVFRFSVFWSGVTTLGGPTPLQARR